MDYVMIRAWGQYMGSYSYYIRDQIAIAKEDKAPGNAIYKQDDGTWATVEQLNSITRVTVERIAAAIMRRANPDHPYGSPRMVR